MHKRCQETLFARDKSEASTVNIWNSFLQAVYIGDKRGGVISPKRLSFGNGEGTLHTLPTNLCTASTMYILQP